MNNSPIERATHTLNTIIYGTIATASQDGKPWAAPQFITFDADKATFYWCASRKSQHAQNILANHEAYITVYDSRALPGEGDGVYAQAQADEVTDADELAKAFAQLRQRHGDVPYWSLEDVQSPDSPVTLFKATVQKMWINAGGEEDGHFVLRRESVPFRSS